MWSWISSETVVKAILKTTADVSEDRSIGLVVGDSGVGTIEQVKAIAKKIAPGIRFDAQSIVKLHALANLEREGALRLVETTIKTSVRIAKAAKLPGVNGQIIDMATKSSAGKHARAGRLHMHTVVEQSPAPTGEIVRRSKVG